MTPSVAKPKMLFVDDRSRRIHSALRKYGEEYDVTIAPNVPECLRLLSRESWDVISLDYDLDGFDLCDPLDKNSGMEIVRAISKLSAPVRDTLYRKLVIHSTNLVGASLMFDKLKAEGFFMVFMEPFLHDGETI